MKRKTVKVVLEVELTTNEQSFIFDYSIERVYNNAIQNAEYVIANAKCEYDKERAGINLQDWEDLKVVNTKIWNLVRNALFVYYNH